MRTIPWALAILVAVLVATTRLIPVEYRLYNFAAVGALALFAAARIGFTAALAITFAAMLISDAILLDQHHYDTQYLPALAVYAALTIYALLGWGLLRKTRNPLVILGVAAAGSWLFFVTTNFASWLSPVHGYERSWNGLMQCYTAALPFFRGTLIGDLFFTAVLFASHAVLVPVLRHRRLAWESVR